MKLSVVTPPSAVVSLEEAKRHLRVDAADDDALIETYIAAATAWLDGPAGWLGRSLGVQVLEARVEGFGCWPWRLALPCPPVIDVMSVTYLDHDDAEKTVDPADYVSRDGAIWTRSGYQAPAVSSDPLPVAVRYRAGYGLAPGYTENDIPAPIKVAILLLVGQWYEVREASVAGAVPAPMPFAVEALLAPFRVYR